jgi:hypothetical protein
LIFALFLSRRPCVTDRELTSQDLFDLAWKWHKKIARKPSLPNGSGGWRRRATQECIDDLLTLLFECGFEDKSGFFKPEAEEDDE